MTRSLPTALLYAMAKACAGPDEPHLTLTTAQDGVRYAAWRYGVVRLPVDVLDGTPDGIWRLYANGNIRPYDGTFTPEKVRSQVLPLLDNRDRTVAVYESPWMCQVGHGVRRILDRSDGLTTVVDQAFWGCWDQASLLPIWQLGGRSRPLVWAADKETRAGALLMPIRTGADAQVPDAYLSALDAANSGQGT